MRNLRQLRVGVGDERGHGEDGGDAEGDSGVAVPVQPEGHPADDDDEDGGHVDARHVEGDVPGDEDVQVQGGVRGAEHHFAAGPLAVAHQAKGGQVDVRPEEHRLGALSPLVRQALH